MIDAASTVPSAEPVLPPEAAAPPVAADAPETAPAFPELDVAPLAVAPQAERTLPFEIKHAVGATRQGILDHFLDLDAETNQSMAQIKAALPHVLPGTVEAAVRREWECGRLLRVSPGVYRLVTASASEPVKAEAPPPVEEATWFEALEAWATDPLSWPEDLGPGPNEPGNRIPTDVRQRFADRLRKREARRRDAEAAAARQAEADHELADRLLAVTGGNFMSGAAGLGDLAPVRAMLQDGVPLEHIKIGLMRAVDRRIDTRAPPIASWRDERFLKAVARCALLEGLMPRLVEAWSKAGVKAPQKPVDGSKPSPAVSAPAEPESAPAMPPPHPSARSVDDLGELDQAAAALLRELGQALHGMRSSAVTGRAT